MAIITRPNHLDQFYQIKKTAPKKADLKTGGDRGDRTPGLCIANAALSQLSYIPKGQGCYTPIFFTCQEKIFRLVYQI